MLLNIISINTIGLDLPIVNVNPSPSSTNKKSLDMLCARKRKLVGWFWVIVLDQFSLYQYYFTMELMTDRARVG